MNDDEPQKVYVYLVNQRAHVKIGISTDPGRRIQDLQVGNPNKLRLLSVFRCPSMDAARKIERMLHEIFGHLLIGGEWFDFSDPVTQENPRFLWMHLVGCLFDTIAEITSEWEDTVNKIERRHSLEKLMQRGPRGQSTDCDRDLPE